MSFVKKVVGCLGVLLSGYQLSLVSQTPINDTFSILLHLMTFHSHLQL